MNDNVFLSLYTKSHSTVHHICRVYKNTSEETNSKIYDIFILKMIDTALDGGMGRRKARRKDRRRCGGLRLPPAAWRLGQEEAGGAPAISNCSIPTTSHTISRSSLMHADSLGLDLHKAGTAKSEI